MGPPNSKQVGFVHSHANSREGGVVEDNNFSGSYNNDKKINTPQENKGITSDSDIGVYNVTNKLGYVSTPNGSLQEYNPTTGEVTTISTMMPSDPNDPSRENTINTNGIPAPIPPSLPDLYRNLPKLP